MHLDCQVLGFLLVVFLGSDEPFPRCTTTPEMTPDLYSHLALEPQRQTYTPQAGIDTSRSIMFPIHRRRASCPLYLSQPYTHIPIWNTRLGSRFRIPLFPTCNTTPTTPSSPAKPDKNPTYYIKGSNLGNFHGSSCSRDDPYPETVRC
jgi:hypothetical protein